MEAVREWLQAAPVGVVLVGAGTSAHRGIWTFRGAEGLRHPSDPEKAAVAPKCSCW